MGVAGKTNQVKEISRDDVAKIQEIRRKSQIVSNNDMDKGQY